MPNPAIALLYGLLLLGSFILLLWPRGGLIGYLQRVSQLSARELREDALKHLFKAELQGGLTSLESLAGAINISTARVASLLTELQESALVTLHGESFRLTPTGRDYALRIIRAHRLWERYLAEKTGFAEAEWHDKADRYEHRLSIEELDSLSTQLGNPTHDPHGHLIPTSDGELISQIGQPLTSMPLDIPLRIVHMEDEPGAVYAQLVAEGLHPGMELRISEISSQRVRFWVNSDEHILAPIVASRIAVTQILQDTHEPIIPGDPLHTLQPGQTGQVVALSPRLRGTERRRLMDLGILPGTIIQSEMVSPVGDPTAYRIRGALIALRKEQAQNIRINLL